MTSIRDTGDLPLIVHVVFRLDYGGLENGVVNLVNSLSTESQRHAIVALTEASSFKRRLRDEVPLFQLGKRPGKDPAAYLRLFRLFRRLRPTVVHTRNIGTMDCALVAFLARVPVRVHGEHGWDVFDPDGESPKYRRIRRLLSPFVSRFVTVSDDLRRWLIAAVGIPAAKVTHVYNGVDTHKYQPEPRRRQSARLPAFAAEDFAAEDNVVIGTVTRFSAIKDPMNLVEAFIQVADRTRSGERTVRLAMIGDGELREQAIERLAESGVGDLAWLPGSRDNVPEILNGMDVFVLGSFREGISNTVLEAMATGLPVVATDTGGNRELVVDGATGALVPPADPASLAAAIRRYVEDDGLRESHGRASRDRAVEHFSLDAMVAAYGELYRDETARAGASQCAA